MGDINTQNNGMRPTRQKPLPRPSQEPANRLGTGFRWPVEGSQGRDKLKEEQLLRQNVDRTRSIEMIGSLRRDMLSAQISLADAGINRMMADPEKLSFILSMPTRRNDNSWVILEKKVASTAGRISNAEQQPITQIEGIKRHLNEPARAFVNELAASKQAYEKACAKELSAIPNIDTDADGNEKERKSLLSRPHIRKMFDPPQPQALQQLTDRREAVVNAERILIESRAIGKKRAVLQSQLSQIIKEPEFTKLQVAELESLIVDIDPAPIPEGTKNENLIDAETEKKILLFLKRTLKFVPPFNDEEEWLARKELNERSLQLQRERIHYYIDAHPKTQQFNFLIGATYPLPILYHLNGRREIDFALLEKQLKALNINVSANDLIDASGIQKNSEHQYLIEEKNSARILQSIQECITKKMNPDPEPSPSDRNPVSPEVKNAKKDEQKAAILQWLRRWWDRNVELIDNVYPAESEKNIGVAGDEKTLQQNLVQQGAIKDVWRLIDLYARDAQIASDRSFDDSVKDLRTLQHNLDRDWQTPNPARTVDEKVAQLKDLLKASHFVFEGLKGTAYASLRDPMQRREAFYIAMTEGLDCARLYIDDPMKFSNERFDLSRPVNEYHTRWRESQESSGKDVLDPLHQKFGLRVLPYAIRIISKPQGPQCLPLASGAMSINNWLTHPECQAPILHAILDIDPRFPPADPNNPRAEKEKFIRIFTTGKGEGGVTYGEVYTMVASIRDHVLGQQADMQRSAHLGNARPDSGSPLNAIRASAKTLTKMLRGDYVQKGLALTLIVGTGYAIYKAWNRGGLTRAAVWGIPMFFGLDVALKHATGTGLIDRLSLNYQNEKDRLSSFGSFVRRAGKLDGRYSELTTGPGKEAMRQITKQRKDSKNVIGVRDLIKWRRTLHNGNYENGAPVSVKACVGPVKNAMGHLSEYNYKSDERRSEAYKLLYLSFEALCVDIANKNELGGETIDEKAQRGMELIERRYVCFTDDFLDQTGCKREFMQACGENVTPFDVLVYERPTPAMQDVLENASITEWTVAKLGSAATYAGGKVRQSINYGERKFNHVVDEMPEYIKTFKDYSHIGYDEFMKWAVPTLDKNWEEMKGQWHSLFGFFNTCLKPLGVKIVNVSAEGISWFIPEAMEKTGQLFEFTKEELLRLIDYLGDGETWRPIKNALIDLYRRLFGENPVDFPLPIEPEQLPRESIDMDRVKSDVRDQAQRFLDVSSNVSIDAAVSEWLVACGAATEDNNGNLKAQGTVQDQILKIEHLKREMFCWFAAQRVYDVYRNFTAIPPKLDFRIQKKFTTYSLPTFKNGVLEMSGQQQSMYGSIVDFFRSHYNAENILDSIAADAGAADQAKAAMKGYVQRAVKDSSLDANKIKEYEHYLQTATLNMLLENTLSGSDVLAFKDLKITSDQSRRIEEALRAKSIPLLGPTDVGSIFTTIKTENMPPALEYIFRHPDALAVLRGQEPIQKPSVEPTTPPAPHDPSVPVPIEPSLAPTEEEHNALLQLTPEEMKDTQNQQRVLQAIRGSQASDEIALRNLFTQSISNCLTYKKNELTVHNYLLGVPDAQVATVEKGMVQNMTSAERVRDLVTFSKTVTTPNEKARMRQALRGSVLAILKSPQGTLVSMKTQYAQGKVHKETLKSELLLLFAALEGDTDPSAIQMSKILHELTEIMITDYKKNRMTHQEYMNALKHSGFPSTLKEKSKYVHETNMINASKGSLISTKFKALERTVQNL